METQLQRPIDQPSTAAEPPTVPAAAPGGAEAEPVRHDKLIVSIHIPKTAGTTLASILDYAVNRRILYDYRNLVPADRDEMENLRAFISRFSIIHGHFFYSKYGGFFPDARFITTLRDPVERTISNYFHLISIKDPKHANYQSIVENNLDLVGFSELPNVRSAQSRFVEGRDINDYDIVGMTEDMGATVKLIRRVLELDAVHPTLLGKLGIIPKTNVGHGRLLAQFKHGFVTPAIRKKIRQNVSPDMDTYERAKARFKKLKRKYI